jgi:hypothetical protein
MTMDEISRLDFAYAPPFSGTLDPILIAAEQAAKKVKNTLSKGEHENGCDR